MVRRNTDSLRLFRAAGPLKKMGKQRKSRERQSQSRLEIRSAGVQAGAARGIFG
jgi:hypothetical protein